MASCQRLVCVDTLLVVWRYTMAAEKQGDAIAGGGGRGASVGRDCAKTGRRARETVALMQEQTRTTSQDFINERTKNLRDGKPIVFINYVDDDEYQPAVLAVVLLLRREEVNLLRTFFADTGGLSQECSLAALNPQAA